MQANQNATPTWQFIKLSVINQSEKGFASLKETQKQVSNFSALVADFIKPLQISSHNCKKKKVFLYFNFFIERSKLCVEC